MTFRDKATPNYLVQRMRLSVGLLMRLTDAGTRRLNTSHESAPNESLQSVRGNCCHKGTARELIATCRKPACRKFPTPFQKVPKKVPKNLNTVTVVHSLSAESVESSSDWGYAFLPAVTSIFTGGHRF